MSTQPRIPDFSKNFYPNTQQKRGKKPLWEIKKQYSSTRIVAIKKTDSPKDKSVEPLDARRPLLAVVEHGTVTSDALVIQ